MPVTRRPSHPALNPRLRASIRRIAGSHGARNIRVFGSFARGEQRSGSDLDLLVELPGRCSLLDVARLKVELEGVVRRSVDVIPEDSLKPALRDRILAEARPL
jgi:predicted nucleotidyltransferase